MASVFWPGLFSIIGTAVPLYLAWLYLTANLWIFSLIYGLPFLILGWLLLSFFLLLLVEPPHCKVWVASVVGLYALGFYTVVLLLDIAAYASAASQLGSTLWPAVGAIVYLIGPVGGVWGILAKTKSTASLAPLLASG